MARRGILAAVLTATALTVAACGSSPDSASLALPTSVPEAQQPAATASPWTTPQPRNTSETSSDPWYLPGEERFAFPTTLTEADVPIDARGTCNPFDWFSSEQLLQATKFAVMFSYDVGANDSLMTPGVSTDLVESALNPYLTANAMDKFRTDRVDYETVRQALLNADNADEALKPWITSTGTTTPALTRALDAVALVRYDIPIYDPTTTIDPRFSWRLANLSACPASSSPGAIRVTLDGTRAIPVTGNVHQDYWFVNPPESEDPHVMTLDRKVVLTLVPGSGQPDAPAWMIDDFASAFTVYEQVLNGNYNPDTPDASAPVMDPADPAGYPWPRAFVL